MDPRIQETVSVQTRYRPARLAVVKNVMARLPGTGSAKALLLVAHYDTRSMTPGASDDGYGVATLLETARALVAEPGPRVSDVIFLFTDGEEEGLLGAHAFVGEHPWAADVGVVLNFEARGDDGPALMFQTGDDNGALVRVLGQSISRPAANSLTQAVYRLMPNDTDLSEWLPRTPSLNFANIGGFERYHAPTDTVENADLRTLQHHGAQALALARALAAASLPLPREPSAVYFDAGPVFVRYPGVLEVPLAVAATLLLVAFLVVGHRRGALRIGFAALGLLAVIGIMVASGVASTLLWRLAVRLHPDYRLLAAASPVMKQLHLGSFLAVGAAMVVAFQAAMRRRLWAVEIFAGAAVVLAVQAVLAITFLPGGAFLFTWPLLAALPPALALALRGHVDEAGAAPVSPGRVALVLAMSVPGIFLVGPFVPTLFAAFGPDAGGILSGFGVLLVASMAPAVGFVVAPAPRGVSLGVAAIAAGFALAANLAAPFDRGHPKPDTVFFAVDADAGRGAWCTPDPQAPAWAATLFTGATRGPVPVSYPLADVLAAPAPVSGERGPEIVWGGDAPASAGATVRLRVVPPPGAELLVARLTGVLSARVEGKDLKVDGGTVAFRFYAPRAAGVQIEVTRTAGGPIAVQAVTQRAGFPAGIPTPGPRPPEAMPKPGMMPPWDDLLESGMTLAASSSAR
jgi:hypothetical protein